MYLDTVMLSKRDLTNNRQIYNLIDDKRVTEAENPLNVEFLTKQI